MLNLHFKVVFGSTGLIYLPSHHLLLLWQELQSIYTLNLLFTLIYAYAKHSLNQLSLPLSQICLPTSLISILFLPCLPYLPLSPISQHQHLLFLLHTTNITHPSQEQSIFKGTFIFLFYKNSVCFILFYQILFCFFFYC